MIFGSIYDCKYVWLLLVLNQHLCFSEDIEVSDTLEMNIVHTKDIVTEAIPFRHPEYEEQEYVFQ